MTNVIAHYYVDPEFNVRSTFRARVAVEFDNIPKPGNLVIIDRSKMDMNDTLLGPGVYLVKEVRPNRNHPDPIYDYTKYRVWTEMQPCKMIIVEPIATVPRDNHDIAFTILSSINSEAVVTQKIVMVNTSTGEIIKEVIYE